MAAQLSWGLDAVLAAAKLPTALASNITADVLQIGAVDVAELRFEDWQALPTWSQLRPLASALSYCLDCAWCCCLSPLG